MPDFSLLEQLRPRDLRELAYKLSPGFLRGHWGERLVATVAGLMSDVLLDGAYLAINMRSLRSPLFPPDGLDLMGSERAMPRFPGESHVTYKARLLDAWKIWQQAGTRGGIIALFARLGFSVTIKNNNEWNWDGDANNWSRFWVIITDHPWVADGTWDSPGVWDDGGTWDTNATPDEVRAVRNIVRNFKGAHETSPATVIVLDETAWNAGQPNGNWKYPWNRNQAASYWDVAPAAYVPPFQDIPVAPDIPGAAPDPGPPSGGGTGTGTGTGSGGGTGTGTGSGGGTTTPPNTQTWSTLSVMSVVNPMDFGAVGNGTADDLNALLAAVNGLPSTGGIVFLPAGRSFRKTNLLTVTKNHVKFWAINRSAEIFGSVGSNQVGRQSVISRSSTGFGLFGLKLRSDATSRGDQLEDHHIACDHTSLVEVAGCEIQGSRATGMFLYGSNEHYIERNYVHHTYADHIHHTNAARGSWCWGNWIYNTSPSNGDDGIASVTYGESAPRNADMEWWKNAILHTGWGRGYSVIGGDNINIHDNWAIGVAGAGIIVASEAGFSSSASNNITIARNYVYQCGTPAIQHPGILISGLNGAAGPLTNIALLDNVSASNPYGSYRVEGSTSNVTNTNLRTDTGSIPSPIPTTSSVAMGDATVLRTRDVSHVAAGFRPGLYRIHVRQTPGGTGYQQRFEYIFKGTPTAVSAFVETRQSAGDYLSEQRVVNGTAYALLLPPQPITLASGLTAVTFSDLRAGAQAGTLDWLWNRVDLGNY